MMTMVSHDVLVGGETSQEADSRTELDPVTYPENNMTDLLSYRLITHL